MIFLSLVSIFNVDLDVFLLSAILNRTQSSVSIANKFSTVLSTVGLLASICRTCRLSSMASFF